MARRALTVIHKPAGYEAYKDQVPIRKANWRAIFAIVSTIFVCGALTSGVFVVPRLFAPAPLPTLAPTIEFAKTDLTPTETLGFRVAVNEALPTHTQAPTMTATLTPTPTHTPDYGATLAVIQQTLEAETPTPAPTSDFLATLEAQQERLNQLALTPIPTATAEPQQVAIVIVDVALIRRLPGTDYRAMMRVEEGARLRVLSQAYGWVEVEYLPNSVGWISGSLVRIEEEQ